MVGNGILNVVEGEDLTGGAAWKPVSVDASGGPPDFTGFVDDGFDVRDPIYGGDLYQPSLEAIQSVRIVRGFDRSKYGGEPSVVYISTKSGTNQYHGFAFEYNEVGALSARPFGRNYSVPLTYNQAGWSKASLVIGITARATRHRKRGGGNPTTAGIWVDVGLVIRDRAWLGCVKIQPFVYGFNGDSGSHAKILISGEIAAAVPGTYLLSAEAGGTEASSIVKVFEGSDKFVLVLTISKPRLWWTWDLGEPYLYTCRLKLAAGGRTVDNQDIPFGVRTIALDEKTGEWRLNGLRFFIRGANSCPEWYLSTYTPPRIARDIKLLRDCNINGVCICVHVNREELYRTLDEAGIFVWQDFLMNPGYVHSNRLFQEASNQLRDMITQFYNHPSIIAWVCQNESTGGNLKLMDTFLVQVEEEEDSSRPTSPVAGFSEHLL